MSQPNRWPILQWPPCSVCGHETGLPDYESCPHTCLECEGTRVELDGSPCLGCAGTGLRQLAAGQSRETS